MVDPKIVPPIILTSILPFGLSEDGKKFRFSLCIDLRSDYTLQDAAGKPYEAAPDYQKLAQFIRSYGSSDPLLSIHKFLLENISIRIDGVGPIKGSPCFKEFENVIAVWKNLLPESRSGKDEEVSLGKFKKNNLTNAKTTAFVDNQVLEDESLNPKNIFGKNVSAFETRADKKITSLLDARLTDLLNLDKYIDNINKRLTGIADFSATQNGYDTDVYFRKNKKGLHTAVDDSTDSIMETFGFISGNILLQRLFGVTIDFEIDVETIRSKVSHGKAFSVELQPFSMNSKDYTWQHLSTPLQYFQVQGKGEVIIVKKDWLTADNYQAENFDIGAKLKALSPLKDKIAEYRERIKKEGEKESARNAIMKQVIAIDSAAFTRGLNLYNRKTAELVNTIFKSEKGVALLEEKELTRGYRFAARSSNKEFISLGSRKVALLGLSGNLIPIPQVFQKQEFSVHVDTAIHALVEDRDGNLKNELLLDTAILTWSGENIGMPGVFSNQEDEENFEANLDEGSVSDATEIVTRSFTEIFKEEYFPKSVEYTGSIQSPGRKPVPIDAPTLINIHYTFDKNAKLILGRSYELCNVPEYKNGWGISFNGKMDDKGNQYELSFADVAGENNTLIPFHFKRNEPVKHVSFYLKDQLLKDSGDGINKVPVAQRAGESQHHLVIRNYSEDNDKETTTRQTSTRYILPPPISFEHAFWHNKIFEISDQYGMKESYNWYKKYHWPKIYKQEPGTQGKPLTDQDFLESIRMKEYYSNNCKINYLSDPLSKGFRLEFYLDKNRLIKAKEYEKYEEYEYYFSGKYPYINAWEIVLQDYRDELVVYNNEKIYVRLRKGMELFVTARTILDETYEQEFETYGNYNSYTRYGNNDLLTPPLNFSLVHATQRPLVSPELNNTLISGREIGSTKLRLVNTVKAEQLSTYTDKAGIVRYIEDTVPTGSLELYAKWEEYNDNPDNRIGPDDNWDPTQPVPEEENEEKFEVNIPLTEAQLANMERTLNRVDNEKHDALNYATDFDVNYDIRETKYLEKQYWLLNKSKFTSYYDVPKEGDKNDAEDETGEEVIVIEKSKDKKNEKEPVAVAESNKEKEKVKQTDEEIGKEKQRVKHFFNRRSKLPYTIRILNSRKPAKPSLAARNITLVSVNEESYQGNITVRKSALNRLCLYFERGRLTSGKGERVGILVNEPNSAYNDYFIANGLVSTVGRDILTDSAKPFDGLYRNEAVLLTKANFVVNDPYGITDVDSKKEEFDLESYSPRYVEDLGLMTFLPKFDKKLNLWYLHLELDINDEDGKELNNPFMQFGLVHFQENSLNENQNPTFELSKDCRISEVHRSGFVYIRGTRVFTITDKNLTIGVTVSFDKTATAQYEKPKSKFYAFIEERLNSDAKWKISTSTIGGQGPVFSKLPKEKGYSEELKYIPREHSQHRLVVIETLEWDDKDYTLPEQLYENKNCQIVTVNLFKL